MAFENNDFTLYCFCWHDLVDQVYMADSVRFNRSVRNMARGYLNEFEHNAKMNPKEFELCIIGEFNEHTGIFTPYEVPKVVDPTIVYAKSDSEEN